MCFETWFYVKLLYSEFIYPELDFFNNTEKDGIFYKNPISKNIHKSYILKKIFFFTLFFYYSLYNTFSIKINWLNLVLINT